MAKTLSASSRCLSCRDTPSVSTLCKRSWTQARQIAKAPKVRIYEALRAVDVQNEDTRDLVDQVCKGFMKRVQRRRLQA